jgi:hypothetical protein
LPILDSVISIARRDYNEQESHPHFADRLDHFHLDICHCHRYVDSQPFAGRQAIAHALNASIAIGLIAIPLFLTIAGMLTYVFVGLQKYRIDKG